MIIQLAPSSNYINLEAIANSWGSSISEVPKEKWIQDALFIHIQDFC